MKCTKDIVITAYKVQYVDLREPKPRMHMEEIYTIDKDLADAAGLLHIDIREFIKARYERGGYHVTSVERMKAKCVVKLDLTQLYLDNLPAEEEAEKTGE